MNPSTQSPQGARERRFDARFPCGGFSCPVSSLAERISCEAVVRDLSSRGIGLLLDKEVNPGKLLSAQLFNQAWRRWQMKTMRVVHVRLHENGWWVVGCSFAQPFGDEEFWAMIGEAQAN